MVAVGEACPTGLLLQPVTLCCYEVDSEPVFDAGDPAVLARVGATSDDLACDWRRDRREGRLSPSQALADRLIADGYAGMLVGSFRHGARADDRNLVLWQWGDDLPSRLRLVDDEGRLAAGRSAP